MPSNPEDVTILLRQWGDGDKSAGEELFKVLMPDLRRIAAPCIGLAVRRRERWIGPLRARPGARKPLR